MSARASVAVPTRGAPLLAPVITAAFASFASGGFFAAPCLIVAMSTFLLLETRNAERE